MSYSRHPSYVTAVSCWWEMGFSREVTALSWYYNRLGQCPERAPMRTFRDVRWGPADTNPNHHQLIPIHSSLLPHCSSKHSNVYTQAEAKSFPVFDETCCENHVLWLPVPLTTEHEDGSLIIWIWLQWRILSWGLVIFLLKHIKMELSGSLLLIFKLWPCNGIPFWTGLKGGNVWMNHWLPGLSKGFGSPIWEQVDCQVSRPQSISGLKDQNQ